MRSTNKEESYKAALADGEKRGLKEGFGEILDDGELSKAEVAAIYHIVTEDEMEDAIDNMIADELGMAYFLFNDFEDALEATSRDKIRAKILKRNARYQAMIDAAPEEHIYDFRYHA